MNLMAESTVFDDSKLNADVQGVKQYFWHVEEGDDAGTHITEVPQEQFVISPDGYNLLARSSGVYIRDGLDRIAEFEPDGVNFNAIVDGSLVSVAEYGVNGARIGESTKTHTIIDADGMQIYASDGSTLIANLGYGLGTGDETTDTAPFFTLGERDSGTIGNYSLVNGRWNIASGYCAYAGGLRTEAIGDCSMSFGHKTKAFSARSRVGGLIFPGYAFGHSTIARACMAIGEYNTDTTVGDAGVYSPYYFVIGNGSNSNARSDIFYVDRDGNTWTSGTYTQGSDRRLKQHISYLHTDADEFINALKPAYYIKNNEKHLGFYAQDVQEIDTWDCMVGEDAMGYKTLGYTEIIAPLVTYCQHLEKRIEELEKNKS